MEELEKIFLEEVKPLIGEYLKEKELPEIYSWRDTRGENVVEDKEYSNDIEGELLQEIDETRDPSKRRELVSRLSELRQIEKQQIEKQIRNKVEIFIENYKSRITNEIENRKHEYNAFEEKRKQYVKERYKYMKIKKEFDESSKIYKIANEEEKDIVKEIKNAFEEREQLAKEIGEHENKFREFNEIYGDMDFSTSAYIGMLGIIISEMEEQKIDEMSQRMVYLEDKKQKEEIAGGELIDQIESVEKQETDAEVKEEVYSEHVERIEIKDEDVISPKPIITMEDVEKVQQEPTRISQGTIFLDGKEQREDITVGEIKEITEESIKEQDLIEQFTEVENNGEEKLPELAKYFYDIEASVGFDESLLSKDYLILKDAILNKGLVAEFGSIEERIEKLKGKSLSSIYEGQISSTEPGSEERMELEKLIEKVKQKEEEIRIQREKEAMRQNKLKYLYELVEQSSRGYEDILEKYDYFNKYYLNVYQNLDETIIDNEIQRIGKKVTIIEAVKDKILYDRNNNEHGKLDKELEELVILADELDERKNELDNTIDQERKVLSLEEIAELSEEELAKILYNSSLSESKETSIEKDKQIDGVEERKSLVKEKDEIKKSLKISNISIGKELIISYSNGNKTKINFKDVKQSLKMSTNEKYDKIQEIMGDSLDREKILVPLNMIDSVFIDALLVAKRDGVKSTEIQDKLKKYIEAMQGNEDIQKETKHYITYNRKGLRNIFIRIFRAKEYTKIVNNSLNAENVAEIINDKSEEKMKKRKKGLPFGKSKRLLAMENKMSTMEQAAKRHIEKNRTIDDSIVVDEETQMNLKGVSEKYNKVQQRSSRKVNYAQREYDDE